VSVLVVSCVARTCLGDDAETFAALLRGECGVSSLRHFPARQLNVTSGYQLPRQRGEPAPYAGSWLAGCVTEAVRRAGLDPNRQRLAVLAGTGLRELRAVERWALDGGAVCLEDLHFTGPVRRAAPGVTSVLTLSNACSAGGYALALGQDLLELGEADAVVVAAADTMTESMLAMIGRFADEPADRVRPFDSGRPGVLLGEGAAAAVLVPEGEAAVPPVARMLATGLSCDAHHETAPDPDGIRRAMAGAFERAGRAAREVDVVYAHGTGTVLNDPAEAAVLTDVFGSDGAGPLVTAVKGAVGHTSGTSALTSLAMAVHSLRAGVVPPVVGLREPLGEGRGLRLVRDRPRSADVRLAQINAFGFGGVNAVSLIAGPP